MPCVILFIFPPLSRDRPFLSHLSRGHEPLEKDMSLRINISIKIFAPRRSGLAPHFKNRHTSTQASIFSRFEVLPIDTGSIAFATRVNDNVMNEQMTSHFCNTLLRVIELSTIQILRWQRNRSDLMLQSSKSVNKNKNEDRKKRQPTKL